MLILVVFFAPKGVATLFERKEKTQ